MDNYIGRYIETTVAEDVRRKMVFIGGPRQSGKTTPAKHMCQKAGFPEQFSLQSETQTRRWSREYRSRVIRGDLSDLENVQDLSIIESMVIRVPDLDLMNKDGIRICTAHRLLNRLV